ncbi:MAG TPA: hypothetical protein VKR06_38415 [Ktedonosporobacter sp.]|nr:hypothetical protein [Ktedonosporobacter sp.]
MSNISGWGSVSTLEEKKKFFNEFVKPTLELKDDDTIVTADYQVFVDGRDTDYTNTWHFLREFERFREARALATQHLKVIIPLANNMNEENVKGAMLRGIVGGGAFSSKRENDGSLRKDLGLADVQKLQTSVALFMGVANELGAKGAKGKMISLYRTMNVADPDVLHIGQKIVDELPSSTTFSPEFAVGWADTAKSIILSIQVPQTYPMIIQCYPVAIPTSGEVVAPRNQGQQEATIAPSEFTITAIGKLRGKTLIAVDAQLLPAERVEAFLESGLKLKEEQAKVKPKMFSRDTFKAQFKEEMETVKANAILTDKNGKKWQALADWDDFSDVVDLQPL